MTAYSRHNKYVSIPDWFESVNKTETTTHDAATSKGIQVVGTSAVSNTLSDITLYNKFITVDSEINIDHLTIENTALSAVDPIGNLIPETGWKCSNYITVAANTTMIVKSTVHDVYGIVFYDNTQTAINGNTIISDTQNIEVPANAFYFKICCNASKTDFLVQYKSHTPYNKEQLEISNQNISDYLVLNEELKEGFNQIDLNESDIKLLVQNPILLTKDLNGIIKLSLDYDNIEGSETSEMFEWDKSLSAFGYDPVSKTAYSYINGVQQFTTDSNGNQIPVMTDNHEFWEYDPDAADKWIIRTLKPRLSLFDGLMEYNEELDAFFFHKHIVTSGGVTMYAKDEFINVPLIFDSLPIDGKTIKWVEVNNNGIISKVLTAEVDDLVTTLGELTNVGGWANDIPEEDRVLVQKANESNWSSVLVKDLESKTTFKNVFQSGEGNAYTEFEYVPDNETLTFIKGKQFVTTDAEEQNIEGIKTFQNGLKIGNSIIKESSEDIIYVDANLVVKGGVTIYSNIESPNIPSIFDSLPIDWNTLIRDSEGTLMVNPNIKLGGTANWDEINGKPTWLQDDKIQYTEIEGTPDLTEYASKSDLSKVSTKIDDFLEGSNTNGIIDKWKELEIFLEGLDYSPDLAEILSTKADKGTTLADYGITDAYTKDEVNTQLKKYVTIDGNEDVTGVHDFVNGLKIGGIQLSESQDDVLYLDGNLVVKGGITIYGFDNVTASSIMEALKLDSNTLKINSKGELTVIGGIGGASSWEELQNKPDTIEGYGIIDAYITDGVITLGNNKLTPITDTLLMDKLKLYLPIAGGTLTGQLGVTGIGGSWISGKTLSNAAVFVSKQLDGTLYYPILSAKSVDNHIINFGGYQNRFGFYGYHSSQTDNLYSWATEWDTSTGLMSHSGSMYVSSNIGVGDNVSASSVTIGGMKLSKSQDNVLYLEGNLVVSGGVTMYGTNAVTASTIMDAIKVDGTTIRVNPTTKELEVIGGTGGGLDQVALEDYLSSNKYLTQTTGDARYVSAIGTNGNYLTWTKNDTTSDITVPYATKSSSLINSVNLWGQSFNGTKDINGDMIGVNHIYMNLNAVLYGKNASGGNEACFFPRWDDGVTYLNYGSNGFHIRNNSSVTTMFMLNNGNVGINNTYPTEALQVNGFIYSTQGFIMDNNQSLYGKGNDGTRFGLCGIDTGNNFLLATSARNGYNTYLYGYNIHLRYGLNNGTAIFIKNDGKVGINNQSPTYELDTIGSIKATNQIISTVTTGTMPINVSSTTKCTNLNADMLDDRHADDYVDYASYTIPATVGWYRIAYTDINVGNNNAIFFITTSSAGRHSNIILNAGLSYTGITPNGNTVTLNQLSSSSYMQSLTKTRIVYNKSDYTNKRAYLEVYLGYSISTAISIKKVGIGWTNLENISVSGSIPSGFSYNEITLTDDCIVTGNIFATGGITMYSDIRKKTKLNDVELTLKQVADAPLIEHYYNSDDKKTTHVSTIAQYWAETIGNDWFCKKDNEGFYTMEIQNAALASAISIARELSRFEDETDKRLRILEEENKKLKEELLIYKSL